MTKTFTWSFGVTLGLLALAALLVGGVQSAIAVGTNGSFESGTDPGSFTTLSAGSSNIDDWTVASGTVDYIGTYWAASDGARSVDLNGTEAGSISQSIPTVVGATYDVSFALSGNPDGAPSLKQVSVGATGVAPQSYTYDTASTSNTLANMAWQTNMYSFVATTSSTTLSFTSETAGSFGPALDNISITETLPTSTPTTTLTVTKVVVNDSGGTATTSDFTLFIDNATTTSGVATTTSVGAHTVRETPHAGYIGTIGGDCDANGNVTLAAGESKTCIITNNDTATTTPPGPAPVNACSTPGVAPAGYTLRNGTSRSDRVVLAPNTMFVGKGGNDHVTAPDGDYIVCTGPGNDLIQLGDGNSVVNAGGGNNQVRTGSGSQTITTGSGNDDIRAGDGDDTINAGGGNNHLRGEGGADSLNSGGGNDSLNGGAGTDTCAPGGGNNSLTSCEL